MWGSAHGVAAHSGLRGAKATAVVYTGDVVVNTAMGLYKPGTWTAEEWTVDLVNKFVQAAATGVLCDHVFQPTKAPQA